MPKTSRAKASTPAVAPTAAERIPVAYALRDLAVAPENLRFDEPADDGIGELADTIFAAGLLQPLSVRPGRGKEHAAMVLDGRRRLLALGVLLADGRVGDDYPVSCFVETDLARQAAVVVLTNTAVPVHPADVIVAIGKMLKAKLTVSAVAGALGYGEVEIRRLAALSALPAKALEALRAGKITLRQAKLLARLPDAAVQIEIAEAALNGFGFQDWRVTEQLDASHVTVRDRRFGLVGAVRYAQAGGRIESDLFGERADVLLDPERLQAAWTVRVEALGDQLAEGRDWRVVVAVDEPEFDDGELEPFGYGYGMGLAAEALEAWRTAAAAAETAQAALSGRDLADGGADADLVAYLAARIVADTLAEPDREVARLTIFADTATGLDVRVWGPPAAVEPDDQDDDAAGAEGRDGDDGRDDDVRDGLNGALDRAGRTARAQPAAPVPVAVAPQVDLQGVNHGLHELRTDTATRALIRALADDPAAALVALVARLFTVVALEREGARSSGALSICAEAYSRARTAPIDVLDGDVRRRLADRRVAWEGSGLSVIGWVSNLARGEKMALLAEVVALSLDLREARTTSLRRSARSDAVEIAALCEADVTLHWTPDAAFLGAHPKAKLLDMLDAMGAGEAHAGAAKKDELVALVGERAAERGWAPDYLSWASEPPVESEAESDVETHVQADGASVGDKVAGSPPESGPTGETENQSLNASLAA